MAAAAAAAAAANMLGLSLQKFAAAMLAAARPAPTNLSAAKQSDNCELLSNRRDDDCWCCRLPLGSGYTRAHTGAAIYRHQQQLHCDDGPGKCHAALVASCGLPCWLELTILVYISTAAAAAVLLMTSDLRQLSSSSSRSAATLRHW